MSQRHIEVATSCLRKARHYAHLQDWGRSFPHYLTVFQLMTNRLQWEEEFVAVLQQFSMWLETKRPLTDILSWYKLSLEYFPTNPIILNAYSQYLLRYDKPEEALSNLTLALRYDSNSLLIEKNILSAKLNAIPRWHFRMLNDHIRNGAYCLAIQNSIKGYIRQLLDIGCGCGILSFYASQNTDIENITAVESSNALCNIATNALKFNDKIKVINAHSTSLSPFQFLQDVLITEIFDAGLVGEHVLETLIHAWENLLKPSAQIIPKYADLFITGISSNSLYLKHRLRNLFYNTCATQRMEEPYEAEDLRKSSVNYITETKTVVRIKFNDLNHLKEIYNNPNSIEPVQLKCLKSESIMAFAFWFDLYLTDDNKISTNPAEDSVKCWEQAVIFLDHPILVEENQSIVVQVSCVSNKLEVKFLNYTPSCSKCFKVSPDIITYLNDSSIIEASRALHLKLPVNFRVLDLNPFPLYAFKLAEENCRGSYIFFLQNKLDAEFVRMMWDKASKSNNKINLTICDDTNISQYLKEKSLDLIFINPISKMGTLCEATYSKILQLRSALKDGGLMLPKSVTLQLNFIESDYAQRVSFVNDDNLLGFRIAEQFNKYATEELWEIKPHNFDLNVFTHLDHYVVDLSGKEDSTFCKKIVGVPNRGVVSGILYCFHLEYSNQVAINTCKSLFYNCACYTFTKSRIVDEHQVIVLNIRQQGALLKISSVYN